MKSKWRVLLTALGSMALLSYWVVSLWTLSLAFEVTAASWPPSSWWIFALSTFLLLLALSAGSVLALHYSKPYSPLPPGRKLRLTAFKSMAIVTFTQLILWFRVMLTIILEVPLPTVELWLVAMALAWMTTPFVTLGFLFAGARLGLWLERKR